MSETNLPRPLAREMPAPASSTLDAVRKAAQDEIDTNADEPDHQAEFTSGALGLQALNPEISITGDMLGSYTDSETTDKNWDFLFRDLVFTLNHTLIRIRVSRRPSPSTSPERSWAKHT